MKSQRRRPTSAGANGPGADASRPASAGSTTVDTIGYLLLDGWAGRSRTRVKVIGETRTRYKIRALIVTRLAGRARALPPGAVALVPKSAIAFD